jgi:ganglioside GM2 activator
MLKLEMKFYFFIQFLLIFLLHVSARIGNFESIQIKNLRLSKCNSGDYSVMVYNVSLQLGTKSRNIKVSGSLSTEVNLIGPVKASVSLKRSVWGIWIPVPCTKKLGSCTYNNLCDYGYPQNKTCPEVFLKNNVPCRCPLLKGNYTIMPTFDMPTKESSMLTGTYSGKIVTTQNGVLLSCYNIDFILYDSYNTNMYSVIHV